MARASRGVDPTIGDTPYAVWVAQFKLWPLWGLAQAGPVSGAGVRPVLEQPAFDRLFQ